MIIKGFAEGKFRQSMVIKGFSTHPIFEPDPFLFSSFITKILSLISKI